MSNFSPEEIINPSQNNGSNLDSLINHIVSEAGLDVLPDADLAPIKESLGAQINRRLGLIIIDNLNEAGLEKYHQLFRDAPIPDPEKLEKFLTENIIDYQEKVKVGLGEFVQEAISKLKG